MAEQLRAHVLPVCAGNGFVISRTSLDMKATERAATDARRPAAMPVRKDLTRCDGELPDNEVHVWHSALATQERDGSLLELLDAEEKDRASRFKFPGPRNQFVVSHAFLRGLLSRYLQTGIRNIRFRKGAQGKPELAEGDVGFNLSHTEGATVIAVSRARRVGVDVEAIRDNVDPMELASRFFSPHEAEWLRSQATDDRLPAFFSCWTAKESYIKACGGGLSIPLSGFEVIPHPGVSELKLDIHGKPEDSARWSVWQLDLGRDLRCALTAEGTGLTVRIGQWSFAMLED